MKAPCYQCPDRHPGCHGECGKYKAYDLERQRIRLERKANRDALDIREESVARLTKIVHKPKR